MKLCQLRIYVQFFAPHIQLGNATVDRIYNFGRNVRSYMVTTTIVGLATGALAWSAGSVGSTVPHCFFDIGLENASVLPRTGQLIDVNPVFVG